MATQIKTRNFGKGDQFGGGVAGSFLLHAGAAALLVGWAWVHNSGQHWGDANSTAGAVQATMVTALPLPPKPVADPTNILSNDITSPAPVPPTPHALEAPKTNAIPIPVPNAKPAKVADKAAPPPPLHPQQPAKVDPNKAPMGQSAASIPMSSTQTQAGTFSVATQDSSFGTKFGYYNEQIKRKLESEWYTVLLDPQAHGHRVYITFQVQRDGTPTNIRVAQPSGDATLDQSSLSAVRHVDTFGPLPDGYQGSYVNVTYYFDPPPRP
jgi:protein TonB